MSDQSKPVFGDTEDCFGLIQVHGHLRGQRIPDGKGGAKWYVDDFVSDDGAVFVISESDVPAVVWAQPEKPSDV